MKEYEMVIGLEVHCELASRTKIFCSCANEFGGEPNTHCCPICLGMPGTLPVLNRQVVEFAAAVGLAVGGTISPKCKFDRKNYFYPDLPKAYQVSQLYFPICRNGKLTIEAESGPKDIGIHEIHMEEDAGKLIHDPWEDCTLVDYNRCGIPLIEIVSEPDLRSADEVIAYLEKLKSILQYLGVSDCRMQEGSLRADINLSVRKAGSATLGTRTEMKNMNSFKSIRRAIDGEWRRQIELLEDGKKIIQETRRWDDNKDTSFPMRSKEDAQDYRYFPEPDLPPIEISTEWLAEIKAREPELREAKKDRYIRQYDLPEYDAELLTISKKMADIFEQVVALGRNPKEVSNWLMTETRRLMREEEMEPEQLSFSPKHLSELIVLLEEGAITRNAAKEVFEQVFYRDISPEVYVEKMGLAMVKDETLVLTTARKVMAEYPQSVQDYQNGKVQAIGFLIGKVMRETKGKANPEVVDKVLRELLI